MANTRRPGYKIDRVKIAAMILSVVRKIDPTATRCEYRPIRNKKDRRWEYEGKYNVFVAGDDRRAMHYLSSYAEPLRWLDEHQEYQSEASMRQAESGYPCPIG